MLNERDFKTVMAVVKRLISQAPDAAAIIFEASDLTRELQNAGTRNVARLVSEVNDMFSVTVVCRELGSLYTLADYGEGFLILIAADKCVSLTTRFSSASKRYSATPAQEQVAEETHSALREYPVKKSGKKALPSRDSAPYWQVTTMA